MTLKFLSSYSTKPIQLFGGLGALCIGVGVFAVMLVAYSRLFEDVRVNRNPVALIAVFLFLAGLLFITQGLIAELVTRTYFESQGKPTYVVRTMLGRGGGERRGRTPRAGTRRTARYLAYGAKRRGRRRAEERPLAGVGSRSGG